MLVKLNCLGLCLEYIIYFSNEAINSVTYTSSKRQEQHFVYTTESVAVFRNRRADAGRNDDWL